MTQRVAKARGGVAAGMVVVCMLAGVAPGQTLVQDEGPIIVGEGGRRFEGFVLERLDAVLELLAQRRFERHDPVTGKEIVDRETLFRQELELAGDGYYGHRDLVDLRGAVQLRLEEVSLDSDATGITSDTTDFTTLFDLNALMFAKATVPWTVYARRNQTLVNRQFAGSLDSTLTEFGTRLVYRSGRMPSEIQYFHREQDQTDQQGRSDFRLTQDTFTAQSNIRLTPTQRLSFDYTLDSVDRSSASSRAGSYVQNDVTAIHTLDFGLEEQHNLRSRVRLLDRSDDFGLRRLRWDELLWMRHSDRLSTRYDLSYEEEDLVGQNQTFWRGNAQVQHRLFESLVTTVNGGGSRLTLSNGFDSDEVFGDINLDYTKRVPLGRFDANGTVSINQQDNSARGGSVLINNDPRTFNDPFPITITRRNIVPGSIVVTDSADVRVFVDGLDYTSRVLPDRLEIRRLVGGAIADGETVLVDYEIGPEPSSEIRTTVASLSLGYTINEGPLAGLTFFGQYVNTGQNLETVDPSFFTVEDKQRVRYGMDYRRGGLFLSAEREHLFSDFSPFEATRIDATYRYRMGRATALTLDGNYTVTDFTDDNNRITLVRVRGGWIQQVNPDVSFKVRLTFRDEQDKFSRDTRGFEQEFEIRWRRNQTDIVFEANNSILESSREDNIFQFFSLTIRRTF